MTTPVFPSLPGLTFPVVRSALWDTNTQTNMSGKEVRIANQTYPRYKWECSISILRSDSNAELQTLMGFYNSMQGGFGVFNYLDADDNAVTGQAIGTGNGSTSNFNLVRTFGGFAEPVLACYNISALKVNGVTKSYGTDFTSLTNGFGTYAVQFTSPPASGAVITCDFQYYWPCKFSDDTLAFSMMMNKFYEVKKISWESVKN